DAMYEAYLDALATLTEYLIQNYGVEVKFVCSQVKMDPQVVPHIVSRVGVDNRISSIDTSTVNDYLLAVTGASLIVASRLHALILALSVGTPSIAISAVRKVEQQMKDIGMEQYHFDMRS